MTRALVQQMLEALNTCGYEDHGAHYPEFDDDAVEAAITASREYLAAPEQLEYVAKVFICSDCQHPYVDAPPSQCDCLGKEQYTEGYIYTNPAPQPTTPEPVNQALLAALKEYAKAGVGNSTDWRVQLSALRMATAAIASAEQAPQPTELSDSDIEELTGHLIAEKEYENWTGREQLVVTGCIDFARAVLAARGGAK
jgi:hypothetical protein